MSEIVFVNEEKRVRAQTLLDLAQGKTIPKTPEQEEARDKFVAFLAEAKVDAKSKDALEFIYSKIGGLVRTEVEQKQADTKKKEAQAKGKKKMIE